MENELCEICGRERDNKNFLVKDGKMFCDAVCYRKSFNKNTLKDTYHDKQIFLLNNIIHGRIRLKNNTINNENADIETDTTNYEFEVMNSVVKFVAKYDRFRDESKKHILIVGIPPALKELFDEVYFWDCKEFK